MEAEYLGLAVNYTSLKHLFQLSKKLAILIIRITAKNNKENLTPSKCEQKVVSS